MNLEQLAQFQFNDELYKKFDIRQANNDLVKDKRELIQLVNDSIFRKCARTSKEKYEVLELRDKLLKLIRYEVNNSSIANFANALTSNSAESNQQASADAILVGTCMDMCPEKERYSRETLSLCNRYEFDENEAINHNLMVKEYSRSSADQDLPLPNELRPIHILFDTMLYLINHIIPQIELENTYDETSFSVGDWYDFVWNRTRSIRKDIIQQRLLLNDRFTSHITQHEPNNQLISNGLGGVIIIEQCARFHIMCAYRLCEQSSNVFDFKINEENLKNCFQSLRQFYETNYHTASSNQNHAPSPNEPEFRSYIIMLNLNQSDILSEIQRWPANIRNSSHVKFALKVYFAFNSRNYVRFFRLIKSDQCHYLQACILHRYFYAVRAEAFKSIFSSLNQKAQQIKSFPLSKLNEILCFESENELYDYCDSFRLEIDEQNVIMPSTSQYSCFKLVKSAEDPLKARRSTLLVEAKFDQRLMSKSCTKEKCLSQIIAGSALNNYNSRFDFNAAYELSTCFNEDGFYESDEIEKMFDYARQKRANLGDTLAGSVEQQQQQHSVANSFLKLRKPKISPTVKIAEKIVKNSIRFKKSDNHEPSNVSTFGRKASTSSSSSTESKNKSLKQSADNKTKTTAIKPKLVQPATRPSIFNAAVFEAATSSQPQTSLFSKPDSNPFSSIISSKPDSNPFSSVISSKPDSNPFSSVIGSKPVKNIFTTMNANNTNTSSFPGTSFGSFGSFEKPAETVPVPSLFKDISKPTKPSAGQPKNLFEDILKKRDQDSSVSIKEKILDQQSESLFETLYLSVVKEVSAEFVLTHRDLAKEISHQILDNVVQEQVKKICTETLPLIKTIEKTRFENEQKQKEKELLRKQEEQIHLNQLNNVLESYFDEILVDIIKNFSLNYIKLRKDIELNVYDDVICEVFQKEFEIIIKQVANELNNELTLDRLAESVYFNNESFQSENNSISEPKDDDEINEAAEILAVPINLESKQSNSLGTIQSVSTPIQAITHLNLNSIFMSDLCSCLHECVYECTRLNLNVNRELYYELKHAIALNEKKHLFRRWRLRLSIKLLAAAHKRASLELKPSNRSRNLNQQINLISFIKSYGNYLNNNLNRLQNILSFMISNTNTNCYSIVHCEQFQMHLTWNLTINYKHYLFEILYENYFHIINNRDDSIILPPLSPSTASASASLNLNDSLDKSTFNLNNSNELFTKTVLIMPKLTDSADDQELDGIKHWLKNKFFRFDSAQTCYETNHIENLFVTTLHSNTYGLRFCIKVCSSDLSQHQYETKLAKRTLYGSNSIIYILPPLKTNETFESYSNENQKTIRKVLRLFNENLDVDSTAKNCQFMFISYLSTHHQTRQIIDQIVGNLTQNSNLTYCLLDGDVVKDNALLLATYQEFLSKIYKQNSINLNDLPGRVNLKQINNILPLSTVFEMTLMKFFEFLTHTSSKKSIYLSLSSIVEEYNSRLEQLIKLLTPDEYKQVSWPVPEFIDSDFSTKDSSYSILKHWNTNECFDNTIKKQLYSLLSLEPTRIDQADESKFMVYLNSLLKTKVKQNTLTPETECIKSVYQLESVIKHTFKNINGNGTINWPQIVVAIVEYLLTNGFLIFQNSKQIYLDKFYFYCNLDKLKSYDWVNNCLSCSSTASSPTSIVSVDSRPSHYIVKKYECKTAASAATSCNLKRRFSDESIENCTDNHSNRLSPDEKSSNGHADLSLVKQLKYQRLSNTPFKPEINKPEFELKFKQFFDLLTKEKENSREFESRLSVYQTSSLKDFTVNDDVLADSMSLAESQQLDAFNVNKTFETFLERLTEEKSKTEQFNSKLNQMLDF